MTVKHLRNLQRVQMSGRFLRPMFKSKQVKTTYTGLTKYSEYIRSTINESYHQLIISRSLLQQLCRPTPPSSASTALDSTSA